MTEHNPTTTIQNIFLKEKPVNTLLILQRNQPAYGSDIQEAVGTTYAHTIKLLKEFKNNGLIQEVDKGNGRTKYYELTEQGEKAAKPLQDLVNTLEEA
ncbi:winged helix DNA-binding protein [Halobacteria archaeon AArc-curdl1]|uniref:Winged helix DNA-binding protein n=1 Tax=Natronosalvus hydrolyticus TaxID=2979988 RepID=A0AAP2Z9Z1_9EURY|nr:winged helix DNA-binding protein [Halobacteria archaeon AArc-curdl1]